VSESAWGRCVGHPGCGISAGRARGRVALVESIITDKDWRAKAWYLERTCPEDFAQVAHRVLVKEVPQQPVPAPKITVIHQPVDQAPEPPAG
jgi:hypothetical protein